MENCSIKPTELSHCQLTELHHLPKGSFLYQQGEAAHEFYYVQAGLIGLFHTLENGKESLVRLYSKGDYFGFRTLFSMTDKHYHCNAKVLIDAEITRIKPNVVSEFFTHNTVMSQCLLQILADELREAEERLAKSAYLRTLDRVIVYISSNKTFLIIIGRIAKLRNMLAVKLKQPFVLRKNSNKTGHLIEYQVINNVVTKDG